MANPYEVFLDKSVDIWGHQVADMVDNALSDSDWLKSIEGVEAMKSEDWERRDLRLTVHTKKNGETDYPLTGERIQWALQKMHDDYPTDFTDLNMGEDDGHTADLFLQLVCFGEERYA